MHFLLKYCIGIMLLMIVYAEAKSQSGSPDPRIDIIQYSDSICINTATGFIQLEIVNPAHNMQLIWSNGVTGDYQDNLTAGSYKVWLTQDNNIVDSVSIDINNLPHSEYYLSNTITACTDQTVITIEGHDLTIPLNKVNWSTADTTLQIIDVPHGHYAVTLTDMYNCQKSLEYNTQYADTIPPILHLRNLEYSLQPDGRLPIIQPQDFVLSAADDCGGEVDILPEQIIMDCNNIGVNTIQVIGVDQHGNMAVDSFYINIRDNRDPVVLCPPSASYTGCDPVFYNDPFIFDNCGIARLHQTSGLVSGSIFPDGKTIIRFEVEDIAGNTASCMTTITMNYGINYQLSAFDASCASLDDGAAVISTQAVHEPVSLTFDNGMEQLYDLPPDTYHFRLTDTLGCSLVDSFTIYSPDSVRLDKINTIQPGDFNGSNGWINIDVSGGVPPYRFRWSRNGQIISQAQNPDNLQTGTYDLRITDSHQCVYELTHIELGHTTSVQNVSTDLELITYPNPAYEYVTIACPPGGFDWIEVFDVSGKLILVKTLNENSITIMRDELGSGMFWARVSDNKTVLTTRFYFL